MSLTNGAISSAWLKHAPKPRPLGAGENWHVFLSYRSVNRTWVLNLYDVLQQLGFRTFIDQCALKPGEILARRLQSALTTSQAGVLIWSRATGDSEWVEREYSTLDALTMKKKDFQFVPIVLDGSDLPPFVAIRVYLDFSSYPDGPNGGELLRLVHGITGQPLTEDAARFAVEQDEAAKRAQLKIKAALRTGKAERILEVASEGGLPWDTSPALTCLAAESLTKLKNYREALDLLRRVRERFPNAIRPKQLYALALARRGANNDLDEAQDLLAELYEAGERDPETLGIFARTWMDRYAVSGDVSDLCQSRDYYAEAFERAPDDYYTGINAAAKSVLLGTPEDLKKADDYAARVQDVVGVDARSGDYWWSATVAEVFLIRKQYADAARVYAAAVAMARKETGSHESTWMQACRLMAKLNPSDEERAMVRAAFDHLPDCTALKL
jgi:tetratricopeptide (TPR) repeat protein